MIGYEIINDEVSRHLQDAEISFLSHFVIASRFEKRHKWLIGLPATILAILLSWLVSQNNIEHETLKLIISVLTPILGLIVAILSGIGTFLNLNQSATQHRKAAHRYKEIHRRCKNWKTDFPDSTTNSNAKLKVQEYRDELISINQEAPDITKWAWKSVKKQKEEGSTTYKTDEKITNP
jgi:hypothetical protein